MVSEVEFNTQNSAPTGPLKLLILNYASGGGGAHVAAKRIHSTLRDYSTEIDVDSALWVVKGHSENEHLRAGYPAMRFPFSLWRDARFFLRRMRKFSYQIVGGRDFFTIPDINTGIAEEISKADFDLVMVNWLGDFTESLDELLKIPQPIVIRTADYWFLNGASHLPEDGGSGSWRSRWSRIVDFVFYGLARKRGQRKLVKFIAQKVVGVISPSHWVSEHFQQKMKNSDCRFFTVPNPIDSDFWAPKLIQHGRGGTTVNLLFGAVGGRKSSWKGYDLFLDFLNHLSTELEDSPLNVQVETFGGFPDRCQPSGFVVSNFGPLNPVELREAYRRADLYVHTSRFETFGNAVLEAMACGTPVASFSGGAIEELVGGAEAGILVPQFDTAALAKEVALALHNRTWLKSAGQIARERVVHGFKGAGTANLYAEAFGEALGAKT